MDLFQKFQNAKNEIVMCKLLGKKADFSELRSIAVEFGEQNNVEFAIDGTEQELWESVIAYFEGLLHD